MQEDIAKVLAQIEKEEAKRSAATEKALTGPPSPRAYATLTPHPTNNELIVFGGEYHNGQKVSLMIVITNNIHLYELLNCNLLITWVLNKANKTSSY